jgi:hypothetical protein
MSAFKVTPPNTPPKMYFFRVTITFFLPDLNIAQVLKPHKSKYQKCGKFYITYLQKFLK